jgi:ribosomal protein L12E/L44/L45/RPP1/RPP2
MKYQNIIVYLIIPLALLSIPALVDNVQAQTNSSNQTASPQQQNQNMNVTQALMKVNIFELKDNLMKAKLAIVDENFEEALTGVRDVESQFLLLEPSPTKFLSVLHKAIQAIDSSDINKSLDALTRIQVTILKAENQIFKAAVADPQVIQQFDTMNKPNINEEEEEEEEEDYEEERIQQFINNEEPNTEVEDYTEIDDS